MAKRLKEGDVFYFLVSEKKHKGYARVIEPDKSIVEIYKIKPSLELYTIEEVKTLPVLFRCVAGTRFWTHMGNITVVPEEKPQHYWRWNGKCPDSQIKENQLPRPSPEVFTDPTIKAFNLYVRSDRTYDSNEKKIVNWEDAHLQIEDAGYTSLSVIFAYLKYLSYFGYIKQEELEIMVKYAKQYYMELYSGYVKKAKISLEMKWFEEIDQAKDIERHFNEKIRQRKNVRQATEEILEEWSYQLLEEDDGPVIYLSLALLQAKKKQLMPEIREKAIEILNRNLGIQRWKIEGGDILREHLTVREAIKKCINKAQGGIV